jgi:hypothetical protein
MVLSFLYVALGMASDEDPGGAVSLQLADRTE